MRGGEIVPLEPKMFALLEVLIQRRPAVVTNIELDEILWPKVYVARTSLTRLVSELRTTLGDSPRESRIIRTIYKVGYAFAANVTVIAERRPYAAFSLMWNEIQLSLNEGENIAGRGTECAVVVDATTVSRRHARIMVVQGVATIEDLASTNGTFLNAAAVANPTPIDKGDVIALGKVLLKVRMSDPSALTEVATREGSPASRPRRAGD